MPFSSEHYLHSRYLWWQHIFYYINSSDVANIYVDYIDIYVQMKRAFPLLAIIYVTGTILFKKLNDSIHGVLMYGELR